MGCRLALEMPLLLLAHQGSVREMYRAGQNCLGEQGMNVTPCGSYMEKEETINTNFISSGKRLQMLTTHYHQDETTNLRIQSSRASINTRKDVEAGNRVYDNFNCITLLSFSVTIRSGLIMIRLLGFQLY